MDLGEFKMKAIGVGYCFNVLDEERIKDVQTIKTKTKLEFKGELYYLYVGSTYEESKKIDHLLDRYGQHSINDYEVF